MYSVSLGFTWFTTTFNMSKTKSMVFRIGGIIKQKEVLYFDG